MVPLDCRVRALPLLAMTRCGMAGLPRRDCVPPRDDKKEDGFLAMTRCVVIFPGNRDGARPMP